MQKFIIRALLFIFISISAYITIKYTISFADSKYTMSAFGALGFALDVLKSLLPASIIIALYKKDYASLSILTFGYLLLMSFSFFASYNLADSSRINNIKKTEIYIAEQETLKQLQASYQKLVNQNYITRANQTLSEPIKHSKDNLNKMLNEKNATYYFDLARSIIISALIELSVLLCHIVLSIHDKKRSKQAQKHDEKYNISQHTQYAKNQTRRAQSEKSSTLSVSDIVQVEIALKDIPKTYQYLRSKYKISQDKAAKVRNEIDRINKQNDQQKNNLIILPTNFKKA